MPEIHNPNPVSENSSEGVRSLIVFVALIFILFFSFHYVWPKSPTPASPAHTPSQTAQAGAAKVPSSAAYDHGLAAPNNFGWLALISRPLYLALRFFYNHGVSNWGWSIVVLTVIFNLLLIWPRWMSMRSSLRGMRIQPKADAIKKRYAHLKMNDPKRVEMNTEMMALYKAEGANMYGGCLPVLLQLPLLFAYVSVLRNTAELHGAAWLWLADLSSPDPLHILPLLIIGSLVLTQLITPAPGMDRSQRRMLAVVMPVVMGFSLWHYASGLSLYWLTGNLINLLIQCAINCSKFGKEMRILAAAHQKKGPI